MESFLHERLFEPIGMSSAIPKFDDVGTFIGSSYVYATARDFARFGELYRNDGVVGGRRVLPEGWRDHARALSPRTRTGSTTAGTGGCGASIRAASAAMAMKASTAWSFPSVSWSLVHLGKSPADDRLELTSRLRSIVDSVA